MAEPVRKLRWDTALPTTKPREWSSYQNEIFDAVYDDDGGDLIVQARAGSAKTTTTIEALAFVPSSESVMLVAFNKGIEQQLAKKAPDGVEVRTLHAYGLRSVRQSLGPIDLDRDRTRAICRAKYEGKLTREVVTGHVQAVSACKNQNLIDPTEDEIQIAMDRMGVETGIQFPKEKMAQTSTRVYFEWLEEQHANFIRRTKSLLHASKDVGGVIDFDDMIWLPNALNLRPFNYDRVFVDEAQDTNPAQVALIERALGRNGRLASVGDDRQAIYGWRGADLTAMQSPDAKHLELPICYRCAKAIVRVAQHLVPDIQMWNEAPDGKVYRVYNEAIVDLVQPGDFVLSRTNAPLMSLWLKLMGAGKVARILGRSVGSGIGSFIKRSKATTIEELTAYTDRWLRGEMSRLAKAKRSTESARDMAKCVEYLSRGMNTIEEVDRRIEEMFTQHADRPDRITLSTVHKAKGLERERVFIMMSTFCWRDEIEEKNIFYVAVTRAQRGLCLVGNEEDFKRCVLGQVPQRWNPSSDVEWEIDSGRADRLFVG